MSSIQDIELSKLHHKIEHDVNKLVGKYMKIMDWDIPENDETEARRLILAEIRNCLDRL